MNITEFVDAARAKSRGKVKAPIIERWNSRVVPRDLHNMGRTGARAYLDSYGKNIAAPKVTELALCAEAMNAPEMAAGFWEVAFNLSTGNLEVFATSGGASEVIQGPMTTAKVSGFPTLPEFPSDLQPGLIATMQPDDPDDCNQQQFILNDNYCGQPKRDGHRNVLFGTPTTSCHQSRSTSQMGMIAPEFESAVISAAEEIGAFILDGERNYLSAIGSEHRSASQASKINVKTGNGSILPIAVFSAFEAVFANGKDLRNATKTERIKAATPIVAAIASYLPKVGNCKIEAVQTAWTTAEKRALAELQQKEGREGEVWTRKDACYTTGKDHKASWRTKYMQETVVKVTGVKYSTTKSRSVASFELSDDDGPCGSVGSGFDEVTALEIVRDHTADPNSVRVEIRHQGRTETGALWHPRFRRRI